LRSFSSVAVAHEGSFTATVFAEINEIHDHIAKDNPTAAKAVILRVEQVIARIARFPLIARAIDPSGVRLSRGAVSLSCLLYC
jgi:plasmid stabilization system protein ParE